MEALFRPRTLVYAAILLLFILSLGLGRLTFQSQAGRQVAVATNLADSSLYLPVVVNTFNSADCSVIQTGIDALPAEGGQVTLPPGKYECSTAIIIDRDNVLLRGAGPATVLSLEDQANSPVIVIGSTFTPPAAIRRNIQVMNLSIQGNRLNQTLECWGGACDSGGLSYIRNNGITVRGAVGVNIQNVAVYSARSGGLVTEKNSSQITVRDFTAVDNYYDGLAAYQTEYSIFSGLYLVNNCAAGLSFDLGFNHNIVSQVIIRRDGSRQCTTTPKDGTDGVFMLNSRDNLLQDLMINNSREHGLFVGDAGSPATAATGNTFIGLVVSGSGWDANPNSEGYCVDGFVGGVGFCLNNSTAVNNLVVGSQFINNRGGCVREPTPGLLNQFGNLCR